MPEHTRNAIAPLCDLHLYDANSVPLGHALAMLRKDYGIKRLVCEGGGQLLKALAKEDLLDEIQLTIAPIIFGGKAAPTLTGLTGDFLAQPLDFRIAGFETNAGECYLHLIRRRSNNRRG
jgi:riboflavin biosynthesis pyrimidine reductase